jgi:iron-sulfur cluster assembly accessory protein
MSQEARMEQQTKTNRHADSRLTLTLRAVDMAREIMQRERMLGYGLRLDVVPGGCSGFKYDMRFEPAPASDDIVMEIGGIRVFVSEASWSHLQGVTIDYVSGLKESGFKFTNLRASRTCGCGSSFAAEAPE